MDKLKKIFHKNITLIIFLLAIIFIIFIYKKDIIHEFIIFINFIKKDNFSFVFKGIIPIITFLIGVSTYIYNKKIRIKLRYKKLNISDSIELGMYNDSIRPQSYLLIGISLSKNTDIFKRTLYQFYLAKKLNIKLFFNTLSYQKEKIYPYVQMLSPLLGEEEIDSKTDFKRIDSSDFISYNIKKDDFVNAVFNLLIDEKNKKILKSYIDYDEICLKIIFLHVNKKFRIGSLRINKSFFNKNQLEQLKNINDKY